MKFIINTKALFEGLMIIMVKIIIATIITIRKLC